MGKKHKEDPFPWKIAIVCVTMLVALFTTLYVLSQRYNKDKLILETKDEVMETAINLDDKLDKVKEKLSQCRHEFEMYKSKESGFWDRLRFSDSEAIEKLNKEIVQCKLERDEWKKKKVKVEKCWAF